MAGQTTVESRTNNRPAVLQGERLGAGVANAINTVDPEVVAIGGGVSAVGEVLLEPVREAARRFVLPGVGGRTEIRLARYGRDAGVCGAALLAARSWRPTRNCQRP